MDIHDYPHTIKPFDHQLQHILNQCESKAWGLFWEQGTAKTKPIIDTAVYLYKQGMINRLLVVAPSGVERNWASDELPKHVPPEFSLEIAVQVFYNNKKHTKKHKQEINRLFRFSGLQVLLVSYDAALTKEGKKMIMLFLQRGRCLYVLDESHNIKAPGAKRTKSIIAQSKYAKYKRLLTGTPISHGPFDVYSQVRFLDEDFWKRRGIYTFAEYKSYFGEFYTRAQCELDKGYDPGFDKLLRYKNLDKLNEWLSEITDRVLKDDVLDLPPKLYTKRYFEMSSEQKSIYNELKEELMVQIGDDLITAELPIVKLLRFQQISCNYLPSGEEEPVHKISKTNPRLQVMEGIRDETFHPVIVWARFREDVNQLMDILPRAVRYDGAVDDDEAERNKMAFQAGDAQYFVGTAQKGGPGLTLTQAKTVVYYSNSFRLIDRLQSEDRAHRAGMDEHPVNIIDIVGCDCVDEHIVTNLRDKRDIATIIQGDEWKDWI
jgi:SNF2 family DNA or RNA helicase